MEKKLQEKKNVGNSSNQEKLSYEQLEQVANNLNRQLKEVYGQLQEARAMIAEFNDIGMLLSIIGKSEYFDSSFINRCSSKIQNVVTTMLDNADAREEADKKQEENGEDN